MASAQVLIRIDAKELKKLIGNVNKTDKAFRRATGSAKQLSNVAGNLGSRLGFVAFQFTFMAGVAGRALQDIGRRLSEFVQEGSKDFSAIGRAISRSGFDIAATMGEDKEAIDLLNNAIRTFGSGTTIFSVQEAAEAFNAVGRAVTFSGNALERAQQQVIITKNVLNLMTIEEQGAEAAAINLIKTMKQFGISIQDAAHAADVLVAVNNQSSITLDGLVRSLGFAGQQARQFGISFEDTAVILGVIQDRLGVLNGGPGRNFSILLESLSDTGTSLNQTLKAFGIIIRDDEGRLNPFNQILTQLKTALDSTGGAGSLLNEILLDQISTTSRGSRALLALVQGFDELQISLDAVAESGGLAADLAQRFGELPEERIKRFKNALNSLRVEFVGGLAPALGQIVDQFRSIVIDSNAQQFFINLGRVIGNNIIPAVASAVKLFKFFLALMGKNELILKVVTGLFIGLVTVLGTLFIVGTLGALISVMASAVARLAASTAFLAIINNAWFISLLRIMAVMAGVFLVIKAVDNIIGIFRDGIELSELPILALNAAMILLGGTLLGLSTGILKVTALKSAFVGLGATSGGLVGLGAGLKASLKGIGTTISTIPFAFRELATKGGMRQSGIAVGNSFRGGLGTIMRTLGASKGPIIAVALIAAAAIAVAFTAKMLSEARASPMFQGDLAEEWDIVGFKMQLATAKTINGIVSFFKDGFADIVKIFSGVTETLAAIFGALRVGDFERALALSINAVREFRDDMTKIFSGDIDLITTDFLRKVISRASSELRSVNDEALLASIEDILRENREAGGALSNLDVAGLFKEIFGVVPSAFKPTEVDQIQKEIAVRLKEERDQILDRLALAKQNTFSIEDPFGDLGLKDKAIEDIMKELFAKDVEIGKLAPDSGLSVGEILEKFITAGGLVVEQFATIEDLLKAQAGNLADKLAEADISSEGRADNASDVIVDSIGSVIDSLDETADIFEEVPGVVQEHIDAILTDTEMIEIETVTREELIGSERRTIEAELLKAEATLRALDSIKGELASSDAVIKEQERLKIAIAGHKDVLENGKKIVTVQNIVVEKAIKIVKELGETQVTTTQLTSTENALLDFINEQLKNSYIPILFQQMQAFLKVEGQLRLLESDLAELRAAIRALTARISGTRVKFKKNDAGQITGFSLTGGVTKSDVANDFGFLASGGIVTGPTKAIIGEKGPEAVIPLSKLEGLTGASIGDINITIEGNADQDTVESMVDAIEDIINNRIRNKPILR